MSGSEQGFELARLFCFVDFAKTTPEKKGAASDWSSTGRNPTDMHQAHKDKDAGQLEPNCRRGI